jgi:hypothetical protein
LARSYQNFRRSLHIRPCHRVDDNKVWLKKYAASVNLTLDLLVKPPTVIEIQSVMLSRSRQSGLGKNALRFDLPFMIIKVSRKN